MSDYAEIRFSAGYNQSKQDFLAALEKKLAQVMAGDEGDTPITWQANMVKVELLKELMEELEKLNA